MTMSPFLRTARKADAEMIARLGDMAGEGVPAHLWSAAAAPGESALAVGIRRAGREEGAFSYRNGTVVDVGGKVAALLIGYRLADPYDVGDLAAIPAVVRPLVELEAEAPGSWYVNVLATLPEQRGKGLGSALLAESERLARESGAAMLSIIVADENEEAKRLYVRTGYRVSARRPVVPYPNAPHQGDWVLMTKLVD